MGLRTKFNPLGGGTKKNGKRFVYANKYSDDGYTWHDSDITDIDVYAYGGAYYVDNNFITFFVQRGGANKKAVSKNGANWEVLQSGSYPLYDTAYGNGVFVYYDSSGKKLYRSINFGDTSTVVTLSTTITFERITFDGEKFLIISGSRNYITTSTDGATWTNTAVTTFNRRPCTSLVYGNGTYVATFKDLNGNDTFYAYSTNRTTWNFSNNSTYKFEKVWYANGQFIALRSDDFYTSVDGVTWTKHSQATTYSVSSDNRLVYGNGTYIIGTNSSDYYILVSKDLINWQRVQVRTYTGTVSHTTLSLAFSTEGGTE